MKGNIVDKIKLNNSRGFTLIELLVVISIISMLSSFILAAISQVRAKGEVAAGLKFSTYNYHGLGADAFVYWDFNDSSLNTVTDFSGNNFTGQINGYPKPTKNVLDTPTGYGSSINFSGIRSQDQSVEYDIPNGVDFSEDGSKLKKHTVSLWVKPSNGSAQYRGPGVYGMIVFNAGGSVTNTCQSDKRCINVDLNYHNGAYHATFGFARPLESSTNTYGWCGQDVPTPIQPNRWSHIAYTYNQSICVLYVNGREIYKTSASDVQCGGSGSIPCFIYKIMLGKLIDVESLNDDYDYTYFSGLVDDVAVYTSSLAAADVERIYAEGLKIHTLADK